MSGHVWSMETWGRQYMAGRAPTRGSTVKRKALPLTCESSQLCEPSMTSLQSFTHCLNALKPMEHTSLEVPTVA